MDTDFLVPSSSLPSRPVSFRVKKQLRVMCSRHNLTQRGIRREGRRGIGKGADWRGVGLPDAPAPVCESVCVLLCLGDDCQQAVPLREKREGGDVSKGGPVCYQREVEIYYPTQSKCSTGALTHAYAHTYTHAQMHRNSHTHTHTHTLEHTHSHVLQTLHRKPWAIMRRHLRADGCVAQTKWDTVRLW